MPERLLPATSRRSRIRLPRRRPRPPLPRARRHPPPREGAGRRRGRRRGPCTLQASSRRWRSSSCGSLLLRTMPETLRRRRQHLMRSAACSPAPSQPATTRFVLPFVFISHGDRGTKALAWTWARTFESPWHGSESGLKANSFQLQSSLALLALLFLRFLLSLPLFQPPSLAPLDSSLCPLSPTIIRFRARRVH